MGILELHFHDSEFVFGPSIGSESASSDDVDDIEALDEATEESSSSKRPVLALLVGLSFALVLGLLAKRAGGGEEEIDLPDAE